MVTITIRQKEIQNENISLYLDIYENGKRKSEFLDLYLFPEVDERAKEHNLETMELARQIRSERLLHPESIPTTGHQLIETDDSHDNSPLLLDWLQTYIDITSNSADFSKSTIGQTLYFQSLMVEFLTQKRRTRITLQKFDKELFKIFFKWLKEDYTPKKYVRKKAKPLTPGTLRNIQQRIVAVFNKAVNDGHIKANPFYKLEKGETFAKPQPKTSNYLTVKELKDFMDSKETSPGVIESQKAFCFSCFTGLRISDIRNLRWSDIMVNEENNTLVIVQQKTQTFNAVPICSTAKALMPPKGDDDYVFHLPSSTCVYDNVRRIARKVGIKKSISYHTSRHTFGTMIQTVTNNIELTKKLMGHRNVKTTTIYADVLTKDKVKAVQNTKGKFGKHKSIIENQSVPATKRTAATNQHPRRISL